MTITAVCGWAISPGGFRNQLQQTFPSEEIHVIYPNYPEDKEEAKSLLNKYSSDLYIGYSLGSLWLMHHQRYIPKNSVKVLLAPILGFTKEKKLGGKTPLSELLYLIRKLKRAESIESVVSEFYQLGKINGPTPSRDELPNKDVLIRGLKFLEKVNEQTSSNWISFLGKEDVFLDWTQVQIHLPTLKVVQNAGHSVDSLLKYVSENMGVIQKSLLKTEPQNFKNA